MLRSDSSSTARGWLRRKMARRQNWSSPVEERSSRVRKSAELIAKTLGLLLDGAQGAVPECPKADKMLTAIISAPERHNAWTVCHTAKRIGADRTTFARLTALCSAVQPRRSFESMAAGGRQRQSPGVHAQVAN